MLKLLVFGDVHGHLQLAFGVAHLVEKELGEGLEALFFCGDVGVFSDETKADSATRRHALKEPLELDFPRQWASLPWPPWIERIFAPKEKGGLGVRAPAVMVNGNHEDFEYLRALLPSERPEFPVSLEKLPSVDPKGKVKYLPSGWVLRLPSGLLVAGLGGVEAKKDFYPKYIRESDIEKLLKLAENLGPFHLLLTHQGPAALQGPGHGSELLDALLGVARVWFHGHSRPVKEPAEIKGTLVYPLEDATFVREFLPSEKAWALVEFDGDLKVRTFVPQEVWRLARPYWVKRVWQGKEVWASPLTAG